MAKIKYTKRLSTGEYEYLYKPNVKIVKGRCGWYFTWNGKKHTFGRLSDCEEWLAMNDMYKFTGTDEIHNMAYISGEYFLHKSEVNNEYGISSLPELMEILTSMGGELVQITEV